ncbi:hypothetical protein [Undibacterium fentianense]|uniref:Lipoprotein n=1 Tax=Undibacterium fentianense TaxID=2828728 RepID=A0A941E1K1_9BURK|nr:hypothetical protein [Undibacterium fentianense]MBR7799567.1 hypothetical protein [Undibacterium fentianense]
MRIFQVGILICLTNIGLTNACQAATTTDCPSCGHSNASIALSEAGAQIVQGSLVGLGASGLLVVESVEATGGWVLVATKSASNAAKITFKLSETSLKQAGTISATTLQFSAVNTGHLLISAGKVIAFIPNELGKILIHHERVR